jgi:hypothetical protein
MLSSLSVTVLITSLSHVSYLPVGQSKEKTCFDYEAVNLQAQHVFYVSTYNCICRDDIGIMRIELINIYNKSSFLL